MLSFTAIGLFVKGEMTTSATGEPVPVNRIPFQIVNEFDSMNEGGKRVVFSGFIDSQEKEELNCDTEELQYQFQNVSLGLALLNNSTVHNLKIRAYGAGVGRVETGAEEPIKTVALQPGKTLIIDNSVGIERIVVGE